MQDALQLFRKIEFHEDHPLHQSDFSASKKDPHEVLNIELPHYLANKGEVVLHASSVVIHNKIFAFAGLSGMGKSTIAHKLVEEGFQLFSDEALVLRETESEVLCYSFPQQIRIWKGHEKESVHMNTQSGPFQLAQLYLLHNDKPQLVSPLHELLQSTYKPSKTKKKLDLRLLNLANKMTEFNLLNIKAYSHNSDSFQSLQKSIHSLL